MLKFPVQPALKAFLRYPIHNPLYHHLVTRHIHTEVSYIGPASYTNIARRFASHPNPLGYFDEKNSEEAVKRGQLVDIHDVSTTGPNDFDVLITDVSDQTPRTEISELVGIPYLQKANKEEANKRIEIGSGFLYGNASRPIFPCVVKFEGEEERAHWVFFLVDSCSPSTFISAQVSVSLLCSR